MSTIQLARFKQFKKALYLILFSMLVGFGPFYFSYNSMLEDNTVGSKEWLAHEIKTIDAQADNLDPTVLKLGLTAYAKARQQGLDDKQVLTIIDYSKPSSERRLWVVDLKNSKVLFNTWVAHGKNSGEKNATSFSNNPRSLKSSLGVFVTTETYSGHKGLSLRIKGLEQGINDNVLRRDVVFHGAEYASEAVAKERGMLGRSWGCMAVSRDTIKPLVDTIKNDTVVVAYYPDQHWLNTSAYLNA